MYAQLISPTGGRKKFYHPVLSVIVFTVALAFALAFMVAMMTITLITVDVFVITFLRELFDFVSDYGTWGYVAMAAVIVILVLVAIRLSGRWGLLTIESKWDNGKRTLSLDFSPALFGRRPPK